MAKGISKGWWIAIGVIVVILLYVVFAYNRLAVLDQGVNGAWSNVENQYQRQADLIPNLVSTVASSVKVETNFVTDVTNARSQWQSAQSTVDKDKAGIAMNSGIAAFMTAVATSENYPVLQANKQYVALTDELTGTQNRIAENRRAYIAAVQSYNVALVRFPSNVIAGMFGFQSKDYYKADASAMTTPSLGTGQLP